jgi:hypothetical protein
MSMALAPLSAALPPYVDGEAQVACIFPGWCRTNTRSVSKAFVAALRLKVSVNVAYPRVSCPGTSASRYHSTNAGENACGILRTRIAGG